MSVKCCHKLLFSLLFLVGVSFYSHSQELLESKDEKQKTQTADAEEWINKASMFLSQEAINDLKEKGIISIDEGRPQIFSNYMGHPGDIGLPYFITSDAVLHAFHVLWETSVQQIEISNGPALKRFLENAMSAFERGIEFVDKEEAHLIAPARKKITILLGVAAVLLGSDQTTWNPDPAIQNLIETEVNRINEGSATLLPEWLGSSRPEFLAIDYQKFKPSGPYQGTQQLENYFRAVKWLQSVPLWTDRDEDFLALYILSKGLGSPKHSPKNGGYVVPGLTAIGKLLGSKNAPDFSDFSTLVARRVFHDNNPFDEHRGPALSVRSKAVEQLLKFNALSSRSNLRIRDPVPDVIAIAFMPEFRLSDSNIFHATTGTERFRNRAFPSGLELAANNGSGFAQSQLRTRGEGDVVEFLKKNHFQTNEFYGHFWDTLGLLNRHHPKAPAIFHSESWKRKTCETVLASWAHMRYAASLHVEQDVGYAGGPLTHPGFVEPNPEFFRTLAELCEFASALCEDEQIFSIGAHSLSSQLQILAKSMRTRISNPDFLEEIEGQEKASWFGKINFATSLLKQAGVIVHDEVDYAPYKQEDMKELVAYMDQIAVELENGKRSVSGNSRITHLSRKWRKLQSLCRDLEVISIKQLHAIKLNDEEKQTIEAIGMILGNLEFYHDNAWLEPRDDAPRIVEIFHNPQVGKRLHVATGRPLTLYILYAHEGKNVLCRGGVMTYYESYSANRLTDSNWMRMLDSHKPPERPDWALPASPQ